jgi:hypothetical protein
MVAQLAGEGERVLVHFCSVTMCFWPCSFAVLGDRQAGDGSIWLGFALTSLRRTAIDFIVGGRDPATGMSPAIAKPRLVGNRSATIASPGFGPRSAPVVENAVGDASPRWQPMAGRVVLW